MSTKQTLSPLIMHPDAYLVPIIHMSPFFGKMQPFAGDYAQDATTVIETMIGVVSDRKLSGAITVNGREAISIALRDIVKNSEDVISIITSSNIGYVSSCVTKEIEKYCRWVFGWAANASAYFVIHEFGRSAIIPPAVIASGKPIIEDCAYAFVAKSSDSQIGLYGDYIIYSLPKAFAMQYGGVILGKNAIAAISNNLSPDNYLLGNLHYGAVNIDDLNKQRVSVYKRMQSASASYGFEEMLPVTGADIASAFIVKLQDGINLNELRQYMNKMGIESSVFYGSNSYFLPCHQLMNDWEIEYIFYHLDHYIKSLN